MPLVSIIVPVYGVERYIERCAVSLFEQAYKDIEYIFVNDATQDSSMEILRDIIVCSLLHQENKSKVILYTNSHSVT